MLTSKRQSATLVFLGLLTFVGTFMVAWLGAEPRISQFFSHWSDLQNNPPWWLEIPGHTWQILLTPTVILVTIVFGITRLCPHPQKLTRAIVVAIVLALTIRYFVWRSLATLNLGDAPSGVLSVGLWLMESLVIIVGMIQLYLMLKIPEHRPEADQKSQAVLSGKFTPSVDIFIPTYNEPLFIVRRTIIGCQALDYEPKKVYLLDDGRRLELQQLARELGCEYLSRPDNRHAKAGNLNHALNHTSGELIAVFDADFIPTQNFLQRTVGFFQDPQTALVQTPQSFYNSDPVAKNLGMEDIFLPDEEIFYRQLEVIKDGAGSPVCSGTSFVIRRSALQEIGGFVTDSITEDYFTGICISAKGYRLVYLNEKLSAGLAAENMAAYYVQRQRWCRGTLQAFFIRANPLTIPGLNFTQRLAHLEGLLSWFTIVPQIYFLLMPVIYAFFNILPIQATVAEWLYFFVPYYLVQLTVFSWLNYRSRSAFISGIYQYLISIPLALTVLKTMINPFQQGFQVTAKGVTRNHLTWNWQLAWPLLLLWGLSVLSFCRFLGVISPISPATVPLEAGGFNLGLMWTIYNVIILSICLMSLVDIPQPEPYEWYGIRRVVKLEKDEDIYWGITTAISETGCEIQFNSSDFFKVVTHCLKLSSSSSEKLLAPAIKSHKKSSLPQSYSQLKTEDLVILKSAKAELDVVILDEDLSLPGTLILSDVKRDSLTVKVQFSQMELKTYRRLIQLLFCRPGQWQNRQTIGELKSIWILLKILCTPPFIFRRRQSFIIPVN